MKPFALAIATVLLLLFTAGPTLAQDFEIGANEAAPGESVDLEGTECDGDSVRVSLLRTSNDMVEDTATYSVDSDGDWGGAFAIPDDLTGGDFELRSLCLDSDLPMGETMSLEFTVTVPDELPRTDTTTEDTDTTTEDTDTTTVESVEPITPADESDNDGSDVGGAGSVDGTDGQPDQLPNTGLQGNTALSVMATSLVMIGLACLVAGALAIRRNRRLSAGYLMSMGGLRR